MGRSTLVRIAQATRDVVGEIAKETGLPMRDVIAAAVERYRRERVLLRSNRAFARWQLDPTEQAAWERPLADGLEKE